MPGRHPHANASSQVVAALTHPRILACSVLENEEHAALQSDSKTLWFPAVHTVRQEKHRIPGGVVGGQLGTLLQAGLPKHPRRSLQAEVQAFGAVSQPASAPRSTTRPIPRMKPPSCQTGRRSRNSFVIRKRRARRRGDPVLAGRLRAAGARLLLSFLDVAGNCLTHLKWCFPHTPLPMRFSPGLLIASVQSVRYQSVKGRLLFRCCRERSRDSYVG